MKKTIKLILLVCLVLSLCTLMFTACDEEEKPNDTNDDIINDDGVNDGNGSDDANKDKHIHNFVDGFCECGENDGTVSLYLTYKFAKDRKSYIVTGPGLCTDIGIIIPSKYNGLPVTEIGEDAFEGYDNFMSIVIPEGVTKIGKYAFRGCSNLMNVTIPASVTHIDVYAFNSCYNLTHITYTGTKAQWEAIEVDDNGPYYGEHTFPNSNYVVYCTDGTIVE